VQPQNQESPQEPIQDQDVQDQEVPEQDSDADMEAGFAAVRGAPAQMTDPAPAAPVESKAEAEPAAEPADPKEPQKDELRALIASIVTEAITPIQGSMRNIAGNVGGLKSELQRLANVQRTHPDGSAAAEGARKASELILKRVAENYPELSKDLAADLSEALGAAQAAPDAAAIEQIVEKKVSQRETQLAAETLDVVRPNWKLDIAARDAAGNPVMDDAGRIVPGKAFMDWLGTKGDDFRRTFWTTNSIRFLAGAVDEFKATQQDVAKPRENKQARLAAAVTPVGRSAPVAHAEIDEEAAMSLGFKAARGM
jgi:hypothetical protein